MLFAPKIAVSSTQQLQQLQKQQDQLSWILMIVVSKVENRCVIPHQWAYKSEQKTGKKREKRGEDAKIKPCRLKKLSKIHLYKITYENHPIPQPKHGSGLSNFPNCGFSESLIGAYSPFLWSAVSI